jgi:excisionase family DNA binding protein
MPELTALLLTERDVIERLRIGRTTLWRLRRDGKLPSINIGRAVRYRAEDVRRLAQNGDKEVAK